MELKELLGDDLYKQVQAKIDEKNSTETDKLKHVRYTDLSEGKYVSKEKYDSELEKLNELITGKDTEIGNANKLIEDLKKASKELGCNGPVTEAIDKMEKHLNKAAHDQE